MALIPDPFSAVSNAIANPLGTLANPLGVLQGGAPSPAASDEDEDIA